MAIEKWRELRCASLDEFVDSDTLGFKFEMLNLLDCSEAVPRVPCGGRPVWR